MHTLALGCPLRGVLIQGLPYCGATGVPQHGMTYNLSLLRRIWYPRRVVWQAISDKVLSSG